MPLYHLYLFESGAQMPQFVTLINNVPQMCKFSKFAVPIKEYLSEEHPPFIDELKWVNLNQRRGLNPP